MLYTCCIYVTWPCAQHILINGIDADLRLVGGHLPSDGRVEVCVSEEWNRVCDNNDWSEMDAQVVCRQLDYQNGMQ